MDPYDHGDLLACICQFEDNEDRNEEFGPGVNSKNVVILEVRYSGGVIWAL